MELLLFLLLVLLVGIMGTTWQAVSNPAGAELGLELRGQLRIVRGQLHELVQVGDVGLERAEGLEAALFRGVLG